MVKKIKLTQGKYALVDDEDYEYLSQWKWCFIAAKSGNGYAVRNKKRSESHGGSTIYMHRVVNKTKDGYETDHKDGNKLNNQKANLRSCKRN